MVIDKFLNNLIKITQLQISTLEKVEIFSSFEKRLNNKIIEIIPTIDCYKVHKINLLLKFKTKINDNYKHHINELSLEYNFKVVMISENQLYISF